MGPPPSQLIPFPGWTGRLPWLSTSSCAILTTFFVCEDFTYLSLERGEKRETGREILMWGRNIDQVPLACALTGDWAHNPGTFSDQNQTGKFCFVRWRPSNWAASVRAILASIVHVLTSPFPPTIWHQRRKGEAVLWFPAVYEAVTPWRSKQAYAPWFIMLINVWFPLLLSLLITS